MNNLERLKASFVEGLEHLCNLLNHPFGCRLAKWADRLDQHWGEVGWKS